MFIIQNSNGLPSRNKPISASLASFFFLPKNVAFTYAQANDDSAHEQRLLVRGQAEDHTTDAEDETGHQDADFAPPPAVQCAAAQGGERRGAHGAGDHQLLPQVVQVHLLLQEQHRAGHHARVVPEEEPSQGGEEGQDVDEARGGGDFRLPGISISISSGSGWRSDEALLSILLSPAAHKVPHVRQAVFIIPAAGHGEDRIQAERHVLLLTRRAHFHLCHAHPKTHVRNVERRDVVTAIPVTVMFSLL